MKLFGRLSSRNELFKSQLYSIESVPDNLLESLLKCNQMFGFEISNGELKCIAPSNIKLDYPLEENNLIFVKDSNFYEIDLVNPSFLPLYTKEPINLLNELMEIGRDEGDFFTQVLMLEHKGNWRENLINQYEAFLEGNERPLANKLLRTAQSKLYKLVDRIGKLDAEQAAIPEVESKILQPNYRMEMRFIIYSEKMYEKVVNLLKKLTFFNEIDMYSVKNKEQFKEEVTGRKLSSLSKNVYFSKCEIEAILSGGSAPLRVVKPIETDTVTPTKNSAISNLASLLPSVEYTDRQIDKSLGKSLESAFQRVGITKNKLKIVSVEQGATLQKITVGIPKDTSFMKIEKNMKNIQATLGKEAISMEIGDKPETVNFYVPSGEREVVYLSKIMQAEEWVEFSNTAALPFVIGEDTIGKPLFADLQKLVHVLICGTTGSGKSVFLNSLILSLLMSKQPGELMFYLIDPKQVELSAFKGFPHVKEVITDMQKASKVMFSLINEMERRYSLFSEVGVRNLEQYNKKSKNSPLPYLCIVIDEFADLMETNRELESVIQRLGQKARASGIHLIIATQRPSVDVITGVIKSNLPSTFCLRLKTSVDYKTVFNKGIPYSLLGNGDGVAAIEGNIKEFERFQSPVISLDDNEIEEVFDEMKKSMIDIKQEGIEIIEPETNLDKLKRVIANTGETRIAELQKLLEIRINLVSDLMKELVSAGWIEKQGRSYVLTVSEEELDKWRE